MVRPEAEPGGHYPVELRALHELVPTEMVDLDSCSALSEQIQLLGHWTHPIPIDAATGLIMDGNHRYQVAKALGLRQVPCVVLSYGSDEVQVADWNSGAPFAIQSIVSLVGSGRLLPYKTTRHRFARPLPLLNVPLAQLQGPA
jgi:hypothetical protein